MEPKKGFFSIVQYCPDYSRLEVANIGVLLSVPDLGFVKARMVASNNQVRKFFGRAGVDGEWLNTVKESLQQRLVCEKRVFLALDEFANFVSTRANNLVLTAIRTTKVRDPEEALENLFAELVERPRPVARQALVANLDEAFRRPSLAPRIRFNEVVTVPVIGRPLTIPYSFQNGCHNLILPRLFHDRAIDLGLQLAIEGDLIQTKAQTAAMFKFIVVPDLSPLQEDKAPGIRRVLSDLFRTYGVRTVWEEDRAAFVEEVEREAHPLCSPRQAV